MQINHKNLKIIKISNDKNGNYLKLEIKLPEGATIIRWSLDDFTFIRMKEIVSKNNFDTLEKQYHYELLPYVVISLEKPKDEQKFIGNVRCVQGSKAARIEFYCSEKFARNIEWFNKEVSCLDDIKHLKWEDFI